MGRKGSGNMDIEIVRDGPLTPDEIEELRTAVGWEQTDGTYGEILQRHYAHYTARDRSGELIAYVSVLSDGVSDAFLLDLMVHPEHQGHGLGKRLVRRVAGDIRDAGIQCIQVTFDKALTGFYERCGFHIFGGGIIDFKHMEWGA